MLATARVVLLALAWAVFISASATLITLAPTLEHVMGTVANALIVISGSIIVARTEQQKIGWILVFLGSMFAVGGVGGVVANESGATWAIVIANGGWAGLWLFIYLILIFPSGTLGSLLSRVVVWIAIVGGVLFGVLSVRSALDGGATEFSEGGPVIFYASLMLVAVVIHLFRFRQRSSEEKRQLKWFLLALMASMSIYMVVAALEVDDATFLVFDAIATSLWPIGILLAILKYRLYDVDRIVSRTVAYVLVVGLLAGVFFGVVATVTALLPAQGSLAIASSTLAVAALFNPLRLRLLEVVDRRFNRARYDAQRVVDEFANGVRNEDETADLVEGLTSVVERTLQPRSVGVWIASEQ